LSGEEHGNRALGSELGNQIALLKALLFHEEPHNGDRIGGRNRVMLLFVALHQQGQQLPPHALS